MRSPLVRECAVVGQFDPERQTNRILAFIVPERRELAPDRLRAELDAWLRQSLAENKLPDRLVFIDALPRSANGKIQRFKLRDQAAALVSGV
ncbi:MAG: hypothetical protein JO047_03290 [Alphaproteobacteria bacterium]|nr:hypothetical protein [Alphaproteobacteria bacterium]